MTLHEAYDALAPVLPGVYSISMNCWNYRHGEPGLQWIVWDGKVHHEATTLDGAVAMAIAAHTAHTQKTAEQVFSETEAALCNKTE